MEKEGYMSRGGGEGRLHVYGRWRRKATCLGEVEENGYMSRGGGGQKATCLWEVEENGYMSREGGAERLHV